MASLEKAISIAAAAHEGQFRKVTHEPYVVHPLRAMLHALKFGNDFAIVAILHDVVEDTDITISSLREMGFEDKILKAVELLTKAKGIHYATYLADIKANPLARIVKILDMEDNMRDLEMLGVESPNYEQRLRKKYTEGLIYLRGR